MGITYLQGDATLPVGKGKKVIAHTCNDVGSWGKGFVVSLSEKSKMPETIYRDCYKHNGLVLGDIMVCPVEYTDNTVVANMIAQSGLRSKNNPQPLSYTYLVSCLEKLADYVLDQDEPTSVHMPMIGTGYAGGDWEIIERYINDTLCKEGIDVFVYKLPRWA